MARSGTLRLVEDSTGTQKMNSIMKDQFSYSARWDSAGLDCSECIHFKGPEKWPDSNGVSRCSLHKVSLNIELGDNNYKEFEWFCKQFMKMEPLLEERILYRASYDQALDAVLKEIPFSALVNSD